MYAYFSNLDYVSLNEWSKIIFINNSHEILKTALIYNLAINSQMMNITAIIPIISVLQQIFPSI